MEENLQTVLKVFGLATVGAGLIGLVAWAIKKRREEVDALARALGGESAHGWFKDSYIRLLKEGIEVRIKLIPAGEDSPHALVLGLMTPLGFELRLRQENVASRALEGWGLLKEVKVGDPLFDERYLVQSSDPARAASLLQDFNRREAVEYFFRKGYDDLEADREAVKARKPDYEPGDLEPAAIHADLDQLRKLL